MKKQNGITFKAAIQSVGTAARRKAFRKKMPVAISEEGKVFLLFSNGTRKPLTPQAMQELRNVKA